MPNIIASDITTPAALRRHPQPGQPRTVEQAALELNVSKSTVRAWIAQRRLGHVRLGRAVRVPADDITRLLEAGYTPARP